MQAVAFEFDVSEPQRKEGSGALDLAYWTYKITARTNLSQYRNMAMVAVRRYSDFAWLRSQLCLTFPGIIVPPIPEKEISSTVQKITTSNNNTPLLQYRQRNLRRFLIRVGAHPTLGPSRLLQEFLEMNETDWGNRMKQAKKKSEGGASSLTRIVSQKISSSMGATVPPEPLADTGLPDGVMEYIKQLEGVLNVLKEKLVIYAYRRKEATNVTKDFGKALMHLGELREMYEDPALLRALTEIGSNAINISSVGVNQSDLEVTQLAESVQYYLGLCASIREVVDVVYEAKSELSYIVSQLTDAQNAKARAEAANNASLAAKSAAQLPTLTALRDAKRKDIQTLEGTFTNEMHRIHQEKLYDFQQLFQCFSDIQVEYADKMRQSWESLIPSIKPIQPGQRETATPLT